jgi:PAS domain S-box-containing protein
LKCFVKQKIKQMERAMNILHLEDNPADSQLVQSMLKKAKIEFEYFFADNEKDYQSHLKNQQIDIILSDYHLPDYSGTEALLFARNEYAHIPFVFVSGTMGEDVAIESLLNGATDYVLKNKLERLGSAVCRAYKEALELKTRIAAEKALQQSEENFHRSIAESPLGIRIVSVEGKTMYANKAFLDIYEFNNLEEFMNVPAKQRYTHDSFLLHEERKHKRKQGQEVKEYELSIIRKNNEIRHIKVSRKEIIWNGALHYQVINQDITEQKKLTHDLIKAKEKAEESDRLKTAFLHNISHEIRTPMNAIVGFSGFLNNPELLPEKRKYFTEIIVQSSNQLLSIITDIVNIATIEAGQEKVSETQFELISTLQTLYEQFLAKAKAQNIDLLIKPPLPEYEINILTDKTKLIQILSNILSNALKFTKIGQISFGFTIKEQALEFMVQDTGIGIAPDMHEEIFNRFRQVESTLTRQFGGSGLGLSISKAYVELMGGKIWLESELKKGSIFYFTIPYILVNKPTQTIEFESYKYVETDNKQTKTILVTEDENSNFFLLEEILADLNINLIRVTNGIEAIDACKTRKIDLVLMDIKMPIMDGYEATKRIREFLPDLPIIAQTAYTSDFDRNKALTCGCTDFISKPFKQAQIIDKISKLLYKS